jgi:alkylation response protein AidB-like acyl-CoA dehydrogenase
VDAIAAAGLFKMLVPKTLGGSEVSPETFVRVIAEVARVDASTAWCIFLPACDGIAAGSLRQEVAWDIFGREPQAYVAASNAPSRRAAAQPPVRAVAVDGGYRVTGRWSFASGCMHATWLIGASPIYAGDSPRLGEHGQPEMRLLFFPVSDCQIIDTWHVIGLRGTGSHDFAVENVFVPHERSLPRSEPIQPQHPGALYAFGAGRVPDTTVYSPWMGVAPIGFAAVCLGIARGAIDAFLELASSKPPGRGKALLRDNAVIQVQVGQAEATWRAAGAYLLETVREAWETVQKTRASTPEHHIALALAGTHAATLSTQVVEAVWNAAGTSGVFTESPLERRFRDIHIAKQNIAIRAEHYGTAGRMLLGGNGSVSGS